MDRRCEDGPIEGWTKPTHSLSMNVEVPTST